MMHHALRAYLRARWIAARYRSRGGFLRWQERQLGRWLHEVPPTVGRYRDLAGKTPTLKDLPVIDKAAVMTDFAAFNRPCIDAEAAWRAIAGDGRIGDYTVGASTGTSGNRGLFVISERERFVWLGTLLAKALPDVWRHPERVAIVLPRNSRLYDSARRTRLIALGFFDLADSPDTWLAQIGAFRPTVIVGPPRALRLIGEMYPRLSPRTMFSAGETLDPFDRAAIEARFGGPLRQIYMATEGLFGVSCPHGTLHLCEDAVHFEWKDAGDGLKTPIVTDFVRRTQVMARYRMNDLLRLSPEPCSCGSPLQAVDAVVGRSDDAFRLPRRRRDGGVVTVLPEALRNAVVDADPRIADFRLVQTGPRTVALTLPSGCGEDAAVSARAALAALFARHGVDATLTVEEGPMPFMRGRKLRRVENRWQSGHG